MLDERCEISNNRAERQAKSYGTGRKNFLFHNSVDGAKSSAIIYSLVETAKANHLNIYQYLYTLLLYMPDYKNEPAGVEAMMPWSDFIKERCSGGMDDCFCAEGKEGGERGRREDVFSYANHHISFMRHFTGIVA